LFFIIEGGRYRVYIVVALSLIVYLWMIVSVKYRTAIAILGSGAILIYGSISNAFPASAAFQHFPTEIVILIIVLSIFTKIFENNGFFEYIGEKFFELSRGRKLFIAALLPTTIYTTSLFMNNLSVILLFTFICLQLAVRMNLPIVPMLVSAIIASNIGGAPLPWADTPAVILTLYTDFNLYDFLSKLFLPCFVYNGLLVLYTVMWFKKHDKPKAKIEMKNDIGLKDHEEHKEHEGPDRGHKHKKPSHRPGHKPKLRHPHEELLQFLRESIPTHETELDASYKFNLPSEEPHRDTSEEEVINENTIKLLRDIQPPKLGSNPPTHDGITFLIWRKTGFTSRSPEEAFDLADGNSHNPIKPKESKKEKLKPSKAWVPFILFIFLILGICIAPFLNISIAYVSLFFGGLALVLNKTNPEDILNSVAVLDSIVFIIALFLIAGSMESSGVLTKVVNYMLTFTGENKFLIVLFIMIAAFVIATFLSAGPAAATVLPIAQQLSATVGDKLVYAALALGILAGSSMLPWSATGGPVMLGEVNRFLGKFKGSKSEVTALRQIFNLREYIKFSIPFSLIILLLSAIFLTLYLIIIMGEKL
jgi:Na+/H+ antiporter NhaD/arsenite permease-like protein